MTLIVCIHHDNDTGIIGRTIIMSYTLTTPFAINKFVPIIRERNIKNTCTVEPLYNGQNRTSKLVLLIKVGCSPPSWGH